MLYEKPKVKNLNAQPRQRWNRNITTVQRGTKCENVDWIQRHSIPDTEVNPTSQQLKSRKKFFFLDYNRCLKRLFTLTILLLLRMLYSVVFTSTCRYIRASDYIPLSRCGGKQVELSDASRESETWEQRNSRKWNIIQLLNAATVPPCDRATSQALSKAPYKPSEVLARSLARLLRMRGYTLETRLRLNSLRFLRLYLVVIYQLLWFDGVKWRDGCKWRIMKSTARRNCNKLQENNSWEATSRSTVKKCHVLYEIQMFPIVRSEVRKAVFPTYKFLLI